MKKDELKMQISLINEGDLQERSMQLFEWLHPGKMKNTVQEMFDLINYQTELISVLQKELIDLRIQQSDSKPVFYPMSYTPHKRH
ncbi:hypothetical protein [Dyadobacter sediminis]|uniref:Uncharacterized protein n=1 Tax=Dyadobacter sediminis TaxID=1493691 RepID=A0A5R9KB26_9BACT|nr:hypothetical protein [Dyadobacter sediminis]TLU92006.1 hypothetical protein FEM55_14695 [Dyadobacter sediminis]GGB98290.1 hypothetical protein GCM10011325_26980 [Dyadobacter sediminis]